MSALDTAQPADPAASPRPDSAEVTGWLLEGRWFTIDLEGRITAWSPAAAQRFGHERKGITGSSFVDTLVAPPSRPACAQAVATAMDGAAADHAGFTGDVDALDGHGNALRAAFALVPIQLSVGYEFNALLQEISSRAGNAASLGELKSRHESVLGLIQSALTGKAAEAAQTEEGGRLAGALVVFRAGEASSAPVVPDNVVSIADAAGVEEVRSQLDRSHTELEEARTELQSLEGQLEESRREAQRSRNEADVARQEANDARDALAISQREAQEAQRQIEEARRSAGDAMAAAEASRIRAEEAQRETERLRGELREARDATRGAVSQVEAELTEARSEAARSAAELEALRSRHQETQRELGTLRAEAEAARAELAQGAAISERRGSEAERLRAELESQRAEAERLTAELNREAAEAADTVSQLERAREELDAARAAGGPVPTKGEHKRLRAVFHSAPIATALVAPDGRFVDANAALCSLLGYPRDRLVADTAPPVIHPDDVDSKLALAARMLAGDQSTARGYRRYVHADGHALTMRESLALLRDADGEPELFILQVEDADRDEAVDGVIVDAEAAEELDAPSEEAMRRALENEAFQLHAQPVIDLRTNEISQYELLIRMAGDDGRLILPQAFLGPARRAGLARPIDRWVVRQAIRLLDRCPAEISLEVNLSPEAINDGELPTLIDQEMASTPIDPGRLILEVTGQTAVDDLAATQTLAKRIRELGCGFALDDFRSTFGSFRLLKDLPLDYLKLDGELVGSLAESRTSQLIVKALVEVARGTGTRTVAVFVSDDDTLALLRQQSVDFAQGYKVGRPRPVAELWPGVEPAALPAGDA